MTAARTGERLLDVDGLRVAFHTDAGVVQAVDGVSFHVDRGEVLAIVGESGSGKTVAGMALMGLNRSPGARFEGRATLGEAELLGASAAELRAIRGSRVAMVFQNPMTALNPVQRVGDQVVEQIRAHEPLSAAQARARTVALFERVGVPQASERLRAYPHELSGGMRQRVVIAMALSCAPELLIADEPTTALDVTTQAQILRELDELRRERGVGVLLVTHDLGVVAEVADRVAVMYAGQIVEQGTVDEVFYDPQHPYTWGLLGSLTRVDRDGGGRLPAIQGLPPSPLALPAGCRFRPRCPHEIARCREPPALEARGPSAPGRCDRCWLEPAAKRRLRELRSGEIGLADKHGEAPA